MPPAPVELSTGYGAYLLQTTLALLAVCGLAALVLRALRRRGVGVTRGLRVVARLPLEPRRTLYVVEAAGKFLLLGVGEGAMTSLAELDAASVRVIESSPEPEGLVALARRALGRK